MGQLYPWQQDMYDKIMAMDPSELRSSLRQEWKADTFVQRYSSGPIPISQINTGRSDMINLIHKMDADMCNSMGIRDTHMSQSMPATEMYGLQPEWVIFDSYFGPNYYDSVVDFEPDNRGEKHWKRTQFIQDTASSNPSDAKRAKLRAKRKKRK